MPKSAPKRLLSVVPSKAEKQTMGKIYVLTNDSMPGIVKIGITEGKIEDRIKNLDNTSLPLPFRFYFAIESDRYKDIGKFAHNAFADYRIRENREFFKVDPERVVAALRISGSMEIKIGNEMIDEKGETLPENFERTAMSKKRYSFRSVGIPIGSKLSFTRDESKECTVVNDTSVEYEGSVYSLSRLAFRLMTEMGYNWRTVQGPAFFEYNGKTLAQIKKEHDAEEDGETSDLEANEVVISTRYDQPSPGV